MESCHAAAVDWIPRSFPLGPETDDGSTPPLPTLAGVPLPLPPAPAGVEPLPLPSAVQLDPAYILQRLRYLQWLQAELCCQEQQHQQQQQQQQYGIEAAAAPAAATMAAAPMRFMPTPQDPGYSSFPSGL